VKKNLVKRLARWKRTFKWARSHWAKVTVAAFTVSFVVSYQNCSPVRFKVSQSSIDGMCSSAQAISTNAACQSYCPGFSINHSPTLVDVPVGQLTAPITLHGNGGESGQVHWWLSPALAGLKIPITGNTASVLLPVGTYIVMGTSGNNNCSDSFKLTVRPPKVCGSATLRFSLTPNPVTAHEQTANLNFENFSNLRNISVVWEASTSPETVTTNPYTHIYQTAGLKTVTIKADAPDDDPRCTSLVTTTVNVNETVTPAACVPAFSILASITPNPILDNQAATATVSNLNQLINNMIHVNWDDGVQEDKTVSPFTHQYNHVGADKTYHIVFSGKRNHPYAECQLDYSTPFDLLVQCVPTLTSIGLSTTPAVNNSNTITVSAGDAINVSVINPSQYSSFSWSFGSNQSGSGTSIPAITYNTPGTYTAVFQGTGPGSCNGVVAQRTITIVVNPATHVESFTVGQNIQHPVVKIAVIEDNSPSMDPVQTNLRNSFQAAVNALIDPNTHLPLLNADIRIFTTTQSSQQAEYITFQPSNQYTSAADYCSHSTAEWCTLAFSIFNVDKTSVLSSDGIHPFYSYLIPNSLPAGAQPYSQTHSPAAIKYTTFSLRMGSDPSTIYSDFLAAVSPAAGASVINTASDTSVGTNGDDTETGICTLERIIDDNSSSAFIQPGDKAAFLIISDEKDHSQISTCIKGSKMLYQPSNSCIQTYSCPTDTVSRQRPKYTVNWDQMNYCATPPIGGGCTTSCDHDGGHCTVTCTGGTPGYYEANCATQPSNCNAQGYCATPASGCTCNSGDTGPVYTPNYRYPYASGIGVCGQGGVYYPDGKSYHTHDEFTCSSTSCTGPSDCGTPSQACCPSDLGPNCSDAQAVGATPDPCPPSSVPVFNALQFVHSQVQQAIGYKGSNDQALMDQFSQILYNNYPYGPQLNYTLTLSNIDSTLSSPPVIGSVKTLSKDFIDRADTKLGANNYFVSALIHDQTADAASGVPCSLTSWQSYGTDTYGALARGAGLARSQSGNYVGSICSASYAPFIQDTVNMINKITMASWGTGATSQTAISSWVSRVQKITYTRNGVENTICGSPSACSSVYGAGNDWWIDNSGSLNMNYQVLGLQPGDVVNVTLTNL